METKASGPGRAFPSPATPPKPSQSCATVILDPYSFDPRRNGTIYAQEPVRDAIHKFESLLLRADDFPNRARIASIWSAGDDASGRGMGKTALLRFFQRRVNQDWGVTEFQNKFFAVAIYVAFPTPVDRRHMDQLAWAALVDVCDNHVLDISLASLRRQLLSEDLVEKIVSVDDDVDWTRLLDDSVLEKHDVSVDELTSQVTQQLVITGVDQTVAGVLAQGQFPSHLRSLRKDGNLTPYHVSRDTKGLDRSKTILFDDLVRFLIAAGFAGGYLFIDDIENLTDRMTRKARTEFAKEFGLCVARPGYANTEHGFFSCVLTTHQQSVLGLAQAWSEAGLSAVAPMNPGAPTSIELPLPDHNQAKHILMAHMDYYRVDPNDLGTVRPFTDEGLTILVGTSQHPRELLTNASHVLMQAVLTDATEISAEAVEQILSDATTATVLDYTDGIEAAL